MELHLMANDPLLKQWPLPLVMEHKKKIVTIDSEILLLSVNAQHWLQPLQLHLCLASPS